MTPFPQTEAGGGDKKQLRLCLPSDSKVMLMFLMVQAENWWILAGILRIVVEVSGRIFASLLSDI